MGPCVKRPLLLAAFERTSQIFWQHLHDMCALSWSMPRLEPMAWLDVLWLVPSPSGGGTVRAIPLPLNPSLWHS